MTKTTAELLDFDKDDLIFSAFSGDMTANLGRQDVFSNRTDEQSIIDDLYAKVPFGTIFDNIITSSGTDYIKGNQNNNKIGLEYGNDIAFGFGGDDIIYGGYGDDRLIGGLGNDILKGGYDNDLLVGGRDDDIMDGGSGNDRLWAHAGNDRLYGGHGHDYLSGGEGNDILSGSFGADLLRGGADNDIFHFGDNLENSTLSDRDFILDFTRGEDMIDLTGLADNGINDFSDLTVTNVWSTGGKVRITADSLDFGFDLQFADANYAIDANDFVFAPAVPEVV